MKTFVFFSAILLSANSAVHAQDYFTGNAADRCVVKEFKGILIKAFSTVRDSVEYFKNEDIVTANFEGACKYVNGVEMFTDVPAFTEGKLTITYRNYGAAKAAYDYLLQDTPMPAHTTFYPWVKGGPMYVCLLDDVIEIYLTINYDIATIIDQKKLEKYLTENKERYNKIAWLSHRQHIIK